VSNISQLEQEIKQAKQVVVKKEKERALACQVKLCDHLAGVPLWKQVSLQWEKHKEVDLFALLTSLPNSKVLHSTHKLLHIRGLAQVDSRGSAVQPLQIEYDQFEKPDEIHKLIDANLPKLINTKIDRVDAKFRLVHQASIKTGEGPVDDFADLIEYKENEMRTTSLPCALYLIAKQPGLLGKILCGAEGLKDYSSSKKQVLTFFPEDQGLRQLSVSNSFLAYQGSGKTFFYNLKDKIYWPLYLEKAAQYFDQSLTSAHLRTPGYYFNMFTGCSVANFEITRHSSQMVPEKDKTILKTLADHIRRGKMVAGKIRTWSNRNLWYHGLDAGFLSWRRSSCRAWRRTRPSSISPSA
jgi:hypothetical protein